METVSSSDLWRNNVQFLVIRWFSNALTRRSFICSFYRGLSVVVFIILLIVIRFLAFIFPIPITFDCSQIVIRAFFCNLTLFAADTYIGSIMLALGFFAMTWNTLWKKTRNDIKINMRLCIKIGYRSSSCKQWKNITILQTNWLLLCTWGRF